MTGNSSIFHAIDIPLLWNTFLMNSRTCTKTSFESLLVYTSRKYLPKLFWWQASAGEILSKRVFTNVQFKFRQTGLDMNYSVIGVTWVSNFTLWLQAQTSRHSYCKHANVDEWLLMVLLQNGIGISSEISRGSDIKFNAGMNKYLRITTTGKLSSEIIDLLSKISCAQS